MATFGVFILPIRGLEAIPDANAIELAVVGDYRSVVKIGQFQTGDLVAYIPEAAVIPEGLLAEMGLTGKLAGSQGNRVKAVRLRGCLSQGICYPAAGRGWTEGQDVAGELGITKYVPPIPAHLAGQLTNVGTQNTLKYDIENYKRFPDVFRDGEPVVFTEKVHGTWTCMGVLQEEPVEGHGCVLVTSKGMSGQGLAFKMNEANQHNLYVRLANYLGIEARVRRVFMSDTPVYVLGETFGVQDLKYGASTAQDETLGFRVFDIFVGNPHTGSFLGDADLDAACQELGLERVPVLYRGPFSREVLMQYTDGKETVSGRSLHIREGIVARPCTERRDPDLGRVQLKSVSAAYLLRKGEATEFE